MTKQDDELSRLLSEAQELTERLKEVQREIAKRMGDIPGEYVDPMAGRKRDSQKPKPEQND
jgi:hypothetical protein